MENPADFTTKGESAIQILSSSLWWTAPIWLSPLIHSWPDLSFNNRPDEHCDELILKELRTVAVNTVVSTETLIDLTKYSNFLKCLRIAAWIKRFVAKARKITSETGPLSARELDEAEQYFIRETQIVHFPDEFKSLVSKKSISPNSSIYSLAPFLDENNLIRIKGRFTDSDFTIGEKHPVLLPRDSRLTELIVTHVHNKMLHAGVAATLSKIRQNFWIIKGRQLVKKVIHNCLICRKYSAKPATQLTGQIPRDRLNETPPFYTTGIDFTGPVYVKTEQSISKCYIALFTCAVTRAVHLELVSDLSTTKFILALRRFLSRRGNCRIIYSDNAKTFKCANKDFDYFDKIIKDKKLQDFVSSERISWKFIVELSPWWGGFYERLMRAIKEPLRKILGRAQLTFEELMTVLTEIENVLNQRPLTYVFNDVNEPEPLTPAHFLLVGHNIKYPHHFAELFNTSTSRTTLVKRKMYQTKLLQQIWTKWKTQYLLDLKNFHTFNSPRVKENLKEGDIVLIEGTSKSKFLWDLGRIIQVFKGRDGLVRSCTVKTKNNEIRRPIQLLYPLELQN